MTDVSPIPESYPQVCPYLMIDGAAAAIDFYTSVLGATERMRMAAPGDTIGHAELQIGDSVVMLGDMPADQGSNPRSLGGTPVLLCVYVDDVDAVFDRAIEAGAKSLEPVQNKFYGDRTGMFEDPWGHQWSVMTHIEDVAPDEMAQRAAEAASA